MPCKVLQIGCVASICIFQILIESTTDRIDNISVQSTSAQLFSLKDVTSLTI